MIEKKDASYNILATPYSVSLEDSFRGTITPVGGGTGSDIDSLWLDFDRAGRYKVILDETSGVRGSLLYMDVKDPQLGDRVLGTDGRAEVTLNIAGETRRPVYIGDQERRLGGDYTLSIEYLGPLKAGVSLDVPYDPKRPIDPTPFIEETDLPGHHTTVVLDPGDTLIGELREGSTDAIFYRVEAGVAYSLWYTGTGMNPRASGSVLPDVNFGLYATTSSVAHFVSQKAGDLRFKLIGKSYYTDQAFNYSFTLAESNRLDEVRDAPGDITTPYKMGKDHRFTGTLTENDSDWVSVRLTAGHTYTLETNPGGSIGTFSPVFRNKKGEALAGELFEGFYYQRGPTMYTATYTGVHYLQPVQGLPSSGEYELVLTDYDLLGREELLDAPAGNTPYVIHAGETFKGTLEDDDDTDGVRFNATQDGWYSVEVKSSDSNTRSNLRYALFADDPNQEIEVATESDGRAELRFYAYAGSEFFIQIHDEHISGPLDYKLSAKLLATVNLDETVDAPATPHTVLPPLSPGDTFKGFNESGNDDFIPFQAEAGMHYKLSVSGFGNKYPFDPQSLYIIDSKGNPVARQSVDTPYILFDAMASDVFYAGLILNGSETNIKGFYKLSFEEYHGKSIGTELDESLPRSRLDDELHGRGGKDHISGGPGKDRLFGERGHDVLYGGDDDDSLYGGRGKDRLFGLDGADILRGGKHYDFLEGGHGDDVLIGGPGPDKLFGEYGDDLLRGGAGRDILIGDFGDDYLVGGSGNDRFYDRTGWDTMMGGEGRDRFIFQGTGIHQLDVINDFDPGSDTIRINTSEPPKLALKTLESSARAIASGHVYYFEKSGVPGKVEVTFLQDGLLLQLGEAHHLFLVEIGVADAPFSAIDFY